MCFMRRGSDCHLARFWALLHSALAALAGCQQENEHRLDKNPPHVPLHTPHAAYRLVDWAGADSKRAVRHRRQQRLCTMRCRRVDSRGNRRHRQPSVMRESIAIFRLYDGRVGRDTGPIRRGES
jgi:hypothetical protein